MIRLLNRNKLWHNFAGQSSTRKLGMSRSGREAAPGSLSAFSGRLGKQRGQAGLPLLVRTGATVIGLNSRTKILIDYWPNRGRYSVEIRNDRTISARFTRLERPAHRAHFRPAR